MEREQKMKKLWLLLLVSICHNAIAALSPAEEAVVKQAVAELMKKNQIPGAAVEIYQDGKPTAYYFGFANKEKKKPVTKQTIFEIGSITKVFTSLLFAQAVDSEKLKFNTSAATYLGQQNRILSQITLQDLATHTAGLPLNAPQDISEMKSLDQYLAGWTPQTNSIGSKWNYSNVGIAMLGAALEKELDQNIDDLYRTQILKPLGMKPLAFDVPKQLMNYQAQGYDQNDRPVNPLRSNVFSSAYGIKVSASDMQRFLSAAVGLEDTPWSISFPMRLTQAIYVKLPHQMQGLAWQIHPLSKETLPGLLKKTSTQVMEDRIKEKLASPVYNGNHLIDKTGSTNGFNAYIAVIPNKKTGIAILTNKRTDNNDVAVTAREILFKLNGLLTDGKKA